MWREAVRLQGAFFAIDSGLVAGNLQRVQAALRRARVGPHHFAGSTGYGHGDLGRAALDEASPHSSQSLHRQMCAAKGQSVAVPSSRARRALDHLSFYAVPRGAAMLSRSRTLRGACTWLTVIAPFLCRIEWLKLLSVQASAPPGWFGDLPRCIAWRWAAGNVW